MPSSDDRLPDSLSVGDSDPEIVIPEQDTELQKLHRDCPLEPVRDEHDLQKIRAMVSGIFARAHAQHRTLSDAELRYTNLAAELILIYQRSSPEIRLR